MLKPTSFHFLDLPKELRVMIYENLAISTKQIRILLLDDGFQIENKAPKSSETQPAITITLQTLPIQILSTCQLIYSEALHFLTQKLTKIRQTIPRIIIDADCLYPSALDNTQKLLYAIVDHLEHTPFSTTYPRTVHPPAKKPGLDPQYPQEVHKWLTQCTYLFLSQRPTPCPFSGFMGTRTYPTVRLIVDVPKVWSYVTYRGLAVGSHTFGTPPMYAASMTSQLSQVYSNLVDYTRGLKHVKCGAILFDQEDERVMTGDGLVVTKTVALDFGVWRSGV